MVKWYTVRTRTRLGIYGQIYPFAFRSSRGRSPLELLQTKGYIWPYIPPVVLIRIQYIIQHSTLANKANLKVHRQQAAARCLSLRESSHSYLKLLQIILFNAIVKKLIQKIQNKLNFNQVTGVSCQVPTNSPTMHNRMLLLIFT